MTITVTPNNDDIFSATRSFLLSVLPSGLEVVMGQLNRVPEVQGTDFVVFTIIHQKRLATNREVDQDVKFVAAVVAGEMLVNEVEHGAIAVGTTLSGLDASGDPITGTTIIDQITGDPGGPGAYTISVDETIPGPTLSAGYADVTQNTEITIQLDVHSDDMAKSSNYAEIISTLFRDRYATEFYAALGQPITPLYANDPRQMPFINSEQQFESRFVVELCLQANQTVRIPQEFMDTANIGLIEVDSHYPP